MYMYIHIHVHFEHICLVKCFIVPLATSNHNLHQLMYTTMYMYMYINATLHVHVAVPLSSGWLSSSDDPLGYVDRIDRRIEDFTGLTMTMAEQLQVRYTVLIKKRCRSILLPYCFLCILFTPFCHCFCCHFVTVLILFGYHAV